MTRGGESRRFAIQQENALVSNSILLLAVFTRQFRCNGRRTGEYRSDETRGIPLCPSLSLVVDLLWQSRWSCRCYWRSAVGRWSQAANRGQRRLTETKASPVSSSVSLRVLLTIHTALTDDQFRLFAFRDRWERNTNTSLTYQNTGLLDHPSQQFHRPASLL